MQHVVEKTDGVPLYVEEMLKAILEASILQETDGRYALRGPLASLTIPATLQDSLMARLDRLETAKGVAQLGSVPERQFSYEVLQAVSTLDDAVLQRALQRLVEAELLYQRGLGSQATYVFKHALIQDTAYQTLLRRTRQAYHERIAQVLSEQFTDLVETQAGLLALDEALTLVDANEERWWEAEVYRLKGELLLNEDGEMPNATLTPGKWYGHRTARHPATNSLRILRPAPAWQSEPPYTPHHAPDQLDLTDVLAHLDKNVSDGPGARDGSQARVLVLLCEVCVSDVGQVVTGHNTHGVKVSHQVRQRKVWHRTDLFHGVSDADTRRVHVETVRPSLGIPHLRTLL